MTAPILATPVVRFGAVLLLCGLVLALRGSPVAAHELGLTRAVATFAADGTLRFEVLVDPESLLAKLEILAGRTPSTNVPVGELPARIEALQTIVQQRTHLIFDGVRVTPAFEYVPNVSLTGSFAPNLQPPGYGAPPPGPAGPSGAVQGQDATTAPTAPTALVRLTTPVPSGARVFQVSYGLVLGSYALTLVAPDGNRVATVWLAAGQESQAFDLRTGLVPQSGWSVAGQYFALGFEHILPKGLDHILFVVGLFLLSASWRALLLQVTMFTVAHSITLGLSMYGVVSLPPAIVEPLIALSITYVAIENLFTSELKPWRAALVFAFGLLHGLGFAGVLADLGLPRGQFLPALLTFNLGVEAGQLAVIGLAFVAVGWWRRAREGAYRRFVVVPASLAIALVGAYWTLTRVMG